MSVADRVLARYLQAADYKEYVERKKREGEKPLDKKEWEARTQGGGKDEDEKGESKGGAAEASKGLKGLKDRVRNAVFSGIEKAANRVISKIQDGIKAVGELGLNSAEKIRMTDQKKLSRGLKVLGVAGMAIGAAVGASLAGPNMNAIADVLTKMPAGPKIERMREVWGAFKGWQIGMTMGGVGGAFAPVLGAFGLGSIAGKLSKWAKGKQAKTAAWSVFAEDIPKDVKEAILDGMMDITDGDIKILKHLAETPGVLKDGKVDEDALHEAMVAYLQKNV